MQQQPRCTSAACRLWQGPLALRTWPGSANALQSSSHSRLLLQRAVDAWRRADAKAERRGAAGRCTAHAGGCVSGHITWLIQAACRHQRQHLHGSRVGSVRRRRRRAAAVGEERSQPRWLVVREPTSSGRSPKVAAGPAGTSGGSKVRLIATKHARVPLSADQLLVKLHVSVGQATGPAEPEGPTAEGLDAAALLAAPLLRWSPTGGGGGAREGFVSRLPSGERVTEMGASSSPFAERLHPARTYRFFPAPCGSKLCSPSRRCDPRAPVLAMPVGPRLVLLLAGLALARGAYGACNVLASRRHRAAGAGAMRATCRRAGTPTERCRLPPSAVRPQLQCAQLRSAVRPPASALRPSLPCDQRPSSSCWCAAAGATQSWVQPDMGAGRPPACRSVPHLPLCMATASIPCSMNILHTDLLSVHSSPHCQPVLQTNDDAATVVTTPAVLAMLDNAGVNSNGCPLVHGRGYRGRGMN